MSSARRTFFKQAGLGVGALAAAATPLLADSATPAGRTTRSELLAAAAHWDELQQQAEPWDTSWAQKITGKYKAMFDVPEVEGGVGVMRAGIWQRQYADVLKAKPADLSTVIVIRHAGIVLAMNQEFWTTYNVGKNRKIKDDDGKTMRFNPVLPRPGQEPAGGAAGLMLDTLIKGGAIALGCGLAFRSVVGLVQKQDKLDASAARAKAMSMLVPGVIMQPSGIFADVMAQEAGCVFVNAV
jgi:hypothetical protein